jgi:hypothetical protein
MHSDACAGIKVGDHREVAHGFQALLGVKFCSVRCRSACCVALAETRRDRGVNFERRVPLDFE